MIKNKEKISWGVFLIISLLSSCGGGSNGVESNENGIPPANHSQNQNLQGYLYYENEKATTSDTPIRSWLVRHDLSTASTSSVLELVTGTTSMSVSDDSKLISVVDASSYNASIFGDGQIQYQIGLDTAKFRSHLLISPNNQNWLFVLGTSNFNDVANRLIIGNKNNLTALVIEGGARSFDWLSDDEIMFIQNDGVARLKGLGLEGGDVGASQWLVRFPGETPKFISISPNKNQIAFVKTDITHHREPSAVFVMEIDGGGERQITEWGASIGGIEWSPDGGSIAVVSAANNSMVCNYVFIIPANPDQLPIIDLNVDIAPATLVRSGNSKPICVHDEYTFSWRSQ